MMGHAGGLEEHPTLEADSGPLPPGEVQAAIVTAYEHAFLMPSWLVCPRSRSALGYGCFKPRFILCVPVPVRRVRLPPLGGTGRLTRIARDRSVSPHSHKP